MTRRIYYWAVVVRDAKTTKHVNIKTRRKKRPSSQMLSMTPLLLYIVICFFDFRRRPTHPLVPRPPQPRHKTTPFCGDGPTSGVSDNIAFANHDLGGVIDARWSLCYCRKPAMLIDHHSLAGAWQSILPRSGLALRSYTLLCLP